MKDLVWDEKESRALHQGRKDAERTASTDSVRTYLRQIGKIALLTADEEVELGQRIEAGLYAAERIRTAKDSAERLFPQLHRDLGWIVRDGQRPRPICWRPTCDWSCRWPSATPAAACPC